MTLNVMMPCYKEADNLRNIIPQIVETLKEIEVDSQLIIVDTMEPLDGTEDICNLYKDSCVKYIPRRGGNFYGDAIRTGIEESDGDYLIILDVFSF